MDVNYNGVLDLLQAVTLPAAAKPAAGKDGQSENSSFAKLLEQQRQQQGNVASDTKETPQDAAEAAPVQKPEAAEDADAQQLRMSLAALAMVGAPAAETQPVVVETAAAAAPMAAEVLPVQPETAEAAPMPELAAEASETQPQAAQQIELPQAVTAPEAAEAAPEAALPQQTAPAETAEVPETELRQTAAQTRPETREAPEAETEVKVEDAPETPQKLFADAEAIPVKVGETTKAAPETEAPEPLDRQLTKPLLDALKQGESRVTVHLTPEALGSVTVEVTRTGDGTLHIALSAERLQTQGLLEKHAGSLQTALAAHGQDAVRVEVQRQEETGAYRPYDGRDGGNQNPQHQQNQERRQRRQQHEQDFLHQLRLGLIPTE